MGVRITIDGLDVRSFLEKAHVSQMAESEKLEGRDGWMFLCGMSAMASFCADSPEELENQALLTEKTFEIAVAKAESDGSYRERLIEANKSMVDFLDALIENEGGGDE